MLKLERGGLVLGVIIGLLIGLALALGVALWVTKAPVPFVNKVPPRTAEQDAAEAERNKSWDPNAPLGGKPVPPRPAVATAPPLAASAASAAANAKPNAPNPRDPAAILAGAAVPVPKVEASGPADGKSAKPGADPFIYFVQAGAFQGIDDAEQRRAKVAMLGLESRLVEREQSGRTVYRVRIGPFDKQAEADAAKDKLSAGDVEAVLVRIERPR